RHNLPDAADGPAPLRDYRDTAQEFTSRCPDWNIAFAGGWCVRSIESAPERGNDRQLPVHVAPALEANNGRCVARESQATACKPSGSIRCGKGHQRTDKP